VGRDMTIHRIQVPPALDARTTGELADNLERAAAQPGGVILLTSSGRPRSRAA